MVDRWNAGRRRCSINPRKSSTCGPILPHFQNLSELLRQSRSHTRRFCARVHNSGIADIIQPADACFDQNASSLNGTTFSLLSPGELLADTSHNAVGTDTYTVSASIDSATPITGVFLDAIKNSALPGGGPGGQYGNGNFVVSEFTLDASARGQHSAVHN